MAQPWLQTVTLPDASPQACRDWINLHQIDMGEASVLVSASQCNIQGDNVLLIVDETCGRQAASHARIAIIESAGLFMLAKNARLLGRFLRRAGEV